MNILGENKKIEKSKKWTKVQGYGPYKRQSGHNDRPSGSNDCPESWLRAGMRRLTEFAEMLDMFVCFLKRCSSGRLCAEKVGNFFFFFLFFIVNFSDWGDVDTHGWVHGVPSRECKKIPNPEIFR